MDGRVTGGADDLLNETSQRCKCSKLPSQKSILRAFLVFVVVVVFVVILVIPVNFSSPIFWTRRSEQLKIVVVVVVVVVMLLLLFTHVEVLNELHLLT